MLPAYLCSLVNLKSAEVSILIQDSGGDFLRLRELISLGIRVHGLSKHNAPCKIKSTEYKGSIMAKPTNVADKYLQKYCEPEITFADWLVDLNQKEEAFDRILVIPLCSEKEAFPSMIESIVSAANIASLKVLTVLIVNHRKDSPEWMQTNNKCFLSEWESSLSDLSVHPSKGAFFGCYESLKILLVDRASSGREFPQKQGVGLARKIGCDIAYTLWLKEKSKVSFAFTSDGDAVLPRDYFVGIDWRYLESQKVSALTFPFEHVQIESMTQNEVKAMRAYDQYLRYYQQGLEKSGSPYAYQNIGSTICFSLPSYGKVRGFPKKEAGEDFYFLNKLRKIGPILRKKGNPIILQGRPSKRVPFGTGKSIIRIAKVLSQGERFLVYHPHIFEVLKILLDEVKTYCEQRSYDEFLSRCQYRLKKDKLYFRENEFFNLTHLVSVMEKIGLNQFLQTKITKSQALKQNSYQFMVWFDSFKTLKFVHELRQGFFSSVEQEC